MTTKPVFDFTSREEAEQVIRLSIGRLLSIGSRPFQDGDIETYESCRALILQAGQYLEEL